MLFPSLRSSLKLWAGGRAYPNQTEAVVQAPHALRGRTPRWTPRRRAGADDSSSSGSASGLPLGVVSCGLAPQRPVPCTYPCALPVAPLRAHLDAALRPLRSASCPALGGAPRCWRSCHSASHATLVLPIKMPAIACLEPLTRTHPTASVSAPVPPSVFMACS